MKLKFSIILPSLVLAMSVGAGLSISSRNKSAEPVEAAVGTYYSNVNGTGEDLLNSIRTTISDPFSTIGYSSLGSHYPNTDDRGDGYLYDIYSDDTKYTSSSGASSSSQVGGGWNKEHTIPQSWWGKGTTEQGCDIYIVRLSDTHCNSIRSSYLFAEVATSTNLTIGDNKLGACSNYNEIGVNSGTVVFEPRDSIKGDMARTYFYAVCRYYESGTGNGGAKTWTSGNGSYVFSANGNNGFKQKYLDMLLRWHREDPVDSREIARNDAVQSNGCQRNRNPFVDHPSWVDLIWGGTYPSSATNYENTNGGTAEVVNGQISGASQSPTISINPSSGSVSVGGTLTLTATTSYGSGEVSWSSDNTSVATVNSLGVVTGVAAGSATITATYSGATDTCVVTVTKAVSSLSKGATSPTKTTYTAGESFDPTGLTITANYSDSTSEDVTNSVVWTPDPLTAGTTDVTGTFGGKTITITGITVNQVTEPEIIDSNSDLSVGDYVVLRTAAGVGVTGWNNNKDATVSETQSEWKKYYVASASNSGFTLKDESANNFIASPGSSNQFIYGSAGTCSTDSDGHLICNSRYLCKNGTNYRFYTSIGSYLPFFIYKVPASSTKTLSSISVETAPTKTTYTAGEYFDPTGLVITRTYSDSTSDTYAYANHINEFSFSPSTSTQLTTSDTSVTITYNSKTCSQPITVNQASQVTLSSISVNTSPTKTSYTLGEYFDPSGLVITRTYSDNSSNTYTYAGHESEFSFDPTLLTPLTTSNTSVTISYDGKNTSQSITVTSSGGQATENEEVIDLTAQGFANQAVVASVTGENSTVTFSKGEGNNDPKYYTNGSAVRAYSGNTITITSELKIASISFTFGSNDDLNAITSNPSGFVSPTWSGSANSVVFTIGGTSGNRRIAKITITYEQSAATITSIEASTTKTFYVGEKIYSTDITVINNLDEEVDSFEFANEGYQFRYEDASSGGSLTNKTFTDAISAAGCTCSLTVQVQRKEKVETIDYSIIPTDLSSTSPTAPELRTAASGLNFNVYKAYNNSSSLRFTNNGYIENDESMYLKSIKLNASTLTYISVKVTNTKDSWPTTSISGTNYEYNLNGYSYVRVTSNYTYSNYMDSILITAYVYDARNLANYIMYEDTQNQCTSKLELAMVDLNKMSSDERSLFENSDDYVISTARERLEAWAKNQGKTIDYTNGKLNDSRFGLTFNLYSNNSAATIIAVILTMCLGTAVVCILIRKKHTYINKNN